MVIINEDLFSWLIICSGFIALQHSSIKGGKSNFIPATNSCKYEVLPSHKQKFKPYGLFRDISAAQYKVEYVLQRVLWGEERRKNLRFLGSLQSTTNYKLLPCRHRKGSSAIVDLSTKFQRILNLDNCGDFQNDESGRISRSGSLHFAGSSFVALPSPYPLIPNS